MTNQLILHNPAQAHSDLGKLWQHIKANLVAGRKQVLELRDYEDAKTDAQRRFYHGYVLMEIAKQAQVNGQRFSMETWKEHFRKEYLGSKRKKVINPITGKKTYRMERVSSESLGVKGYTMLIENVMNFAAHELGVNFYETLDTWSEHETV